MKKQTSRRRPSKARLNKIKLFIFDFDGVFTDNFIYLSPDNNEMKKFYVPDGVGIWLLHNVDRHVAIITGNDTKTTLARARRLKIKHVYQNVRDKTVPYGELKKKFGLTDEECLYMGDDLTDLYVMQQAGIAIAPADSHPKIIEVADWVTARPGGRGAIRETIEMVLTAQGNLMKSYEK